MQTMPPEVAEFTLARAVAHLRRKRGQSARALSMEAGLSPSYVGKLEAGVVDPSVQSFGRIALALGMAPEEVFFCVVQEGLRSLHESLTPSSS